MRLWDIVPWVRRLDGCNDRTVDGWMNGWNEETYVEIIGYNDPVNH